MNFNPDPFKQAQEVIFSRKIKSQNHPLHFNNNPINKTPLQKHLGMYFDPKLDFLEHLKNIQAKVNKSIALLWKIQTILRYQDQHHKQFTKLLLDSTLIMVAPHMTKHTMILFTKSWIQFNIMLPLQ